MRPRRRWAGRLAQRSLLVAVLGVVACGPAAQTCPFQTPVCPDPAPSYAGEVSAIIQTYCVVCHGPGGQEAVRPYTTYADVSQMGDASVNVGPMQRQLLACLMPPAGAAQPTADQKAALIGWLTCGAPNN